MLQEIEIEKKEVPNNTCKYCNSIISGSHHCAGKKAFEYGFRKCAFMIEKLMLYDEQEDDMCIEKVLWDDFKNSINKNI